MSSERSTARFISIEGNDLDGPLFGGDLLDHPVFADEVQDFIGSPGDLDGLGHVLSLRRAD
ncbi:hypothetical protein [Streptomyces sp. NBC_01518]|uniref:hypothetical protein n=1 Tax=Streptomyces sp. NBC_01518 TaxID=2903891 RepID=UPI003866571E